MPRNSRNNRGQQPANTQPQSRRQYTLDLAFIAATFASLAGRIDLLIQDFTGPDSLSAYYEQAAKWSAEVYADLKRRAEQMLMQAYASAHEVVEDFGLALGNAGETYSAAIDAAKLEYLKSATRAIKKVLNADADDAQELAELQRKSVSLSDTLTDLAATMAGDENYHIDPVNKKAVWAKRIALAGVFAGIEFMLGFGSFHFVGGDSGAAGMSLAVVVVFTLLTFMGADSRSRILAHKGFFENFEENYPQGYFSKVDGSKLPFIKINPKTRAIAKWSTVTLGGLSALLLFARIFIALTDENAGFQGVFGAAFLVIVTWAFFLYEVWHGPEFEAHAYDGWLNGYLEWEEVQAQIEEITTPAEEGDEEEGRDELEAQLEEARARYVEKSSAAKGVLDRHIADLMGRVTAYTQLHKQWILGEEDIRSQFVNLCQGILNAVGQQHHQFDVQQHVPQRSDLLTIFDAHVQADSRLDNSSFAQQAANFQQPTLQQLGLPEAELDFGKIETGIEKHVREKQRQEALFQPVVIN